MPLTEQQQAILQAVSDGVPLELAAEAVGVSKNVLYNWKLLVDRETWRDGSRASHAARSAAVEFYEQLPRAKAIGYTKLIGSLKHNAFTLDKYGRYDVLAIDKLLSKSGFRDNWYEHRERILVEHQNVHPAHQQVRQLTDQELLALSPPDQTTEG